MVSRAASYRLQLELTPDTFREVERLAKVSRLSKESVAHGLFINGLLILALQEEQNLRHRPRRKRSA